MNQSITTGGSFGVSNHAHSVPLADLGNGGALSAFEQTISGLKHFPDGVDANTISIPDLLDLKIGGLDGNKVIMSNSGGTALVETLLADPSSTPMTFATRDLNGDSAFNKLTIATTINFPSLTPGQFLGLDLSGNVISTPVGGTIILAPIGTSPNADGMTLTALTLNLEPADALFGGVVSTGKQSFSGIKYFKDSLGFASMTSNKVIVSDPTGTIITESFGYSVFSTPNTYLIRDNSGNGILNNLGLLGTINFSTLTPSQFLALDPSGNVISVPSPVTSITVSPIGSSPNADGLTVTGLNLNLEPATATFGGVLTATTQAIGGFKNFISGVTAQTLGFLGMTGNKVIMSNPAGTILTETLTVDDDGTPGTFVIRDINGDSGFNSLRVGNTINFSSLTPSQFLALDNLGNTISVPAPAFTLTIAPIGGTPNGNGATLTGSTLNLEPASAFFGGIVTNGFQEFGGDKVINDNFFVNGITRLDLQGATYRVIQGTASPSGARQLWNYGTNDLDPANASGFYGGRGSIIRMGSSTGQGDSVDVISEGYQAFGYNSSFSPMDSNNYGFTSISPSYFRLDDIVGGSPTALFNVSYTNMQWRPPNSINPTFSATKTEMRITDAYSLITNGTGSGAFSYIDDAAVSANGASLVLRNGGSDNFIINRFDTGSKETLFVNNAKAGFAGDVSFFPNTANASLVLRNVDSGVTLPTNIPSTDCNTGTLVVAGGVGISGDLNVCGSISSTTYFIEAESNVSQTLSDGTFTPVQFALTTSSNNFPPPTNSDSKFTPTKAGWYQINGTARFDKNGTGVSRFICIQKNGSDTLQYGVIEISPAGNTTKRTSVTTTGTIYFDGSSDYFEIIAEQDSTGGLDIGLTDGALVPVTCPSRVTAHWIHS